MSYQIHTFGCKVNTYDAGLIEKNLLRNPFHSETPVHILNTCAVTAEATKEALRLARKLKVQNPFCKVVVTGCGAQVDTDLFANLPGVDLIIANSHKSELPFIIDRFFKGQISSKVFKSNIFKKEDLEPGGGEETTHTRAFLKIQDGCNSFCTYCVIPFARGKSRSLSVTHLIQRIQKFYQDGVREVVLTGVHIGDYQDDSRSQSLKLEDLLTAVLEKTQMPRVRLTSLEPVEISARLLELFKNSRLCAHFHMSIQSANDDVLKNMKRNYSQKEVRESLLKISSQLPMAFVGMDVIVGFPTETWEQFEDTYLTLADLPWTRLHVFPYSARPGTYAHRLENMVSAQDLNRRAERLRELSLQRFQSQAEQQLGQEKQALVLKSRQGTLKALSRDYWNIEFSENSDVSKLVIGQEISVRVTQIQKPNQKKMESPLLAEVVG